MKIKINRRKYLGKKNIHYYINILLIIYPVFYPIKEIFGHMGQYVLFFIWLVIVILKDNNFIVTIIRYNILYFYFFLLIFIRILFAYNDIAIGFDSPLRLLSQFSLIFIYAIFSLWNLLYSSKQFQSKLVSYFFIFYNISAIISLYYLTIDSYAIRRSYANNYFAVGDFNLVYTGVTIAAICFYLIIGGQYKKIYLFSFIISSLLVLKANYMTAILLLIITIIIILIIKFSKNILLSFILFSFIVLLIYFRERILEVLMLLSNSDLISFAIKSRLEDIYYALSSQSLSLSTTINDRLDLFIVSYETFLDNKLIGVNYSDYNFTTIGNHTQWIDNMARFGIIGNVLFFLQLIIWKNIRPYKELFSTDQKNLVFVSWVSFILLGIINNNMLPGIFIIMFFIAKTELSIPK